MCDDSCIEDISNPGKTSSGVGKDQWAFEGDPRNRSFTIFLIKIIIKKPTHTHNEASSTKKS
eukprot:scaffold6856_cov156-Amphora_coffeaeformis.AAC.11